MSTKTYRATSNAVIISTQVLFSSSCTMYTAPLSTVISNSSASMQKTLKFTCQSQRLVYLTTSITISNIFNWMSANFLILILPKTEKSIPLVRGR